MNELNHVTYNENGEAMVGEGVGFERIRRITGYLRAHIIDNAGVSANRIAVYRMVNRAVSNTALLHIANNRLKCFQILCRIAVQLHIADVSAVGQFMIWCFQTNFLECTDRIVYRHME